MMNDLIERLREFVDYYEQHNLTAWTDCQLKALREAITALTAPTSEEVQAALVQLYSDSNPHIHQFGDLIERLARKVALYKAGNAELYDRLEARDAHIDKLTAPVTDKEVQDMCNQLREQLLLIPMKNGGEMVTGIGEYAADLIERLARECEKLTAPLPDEVEETRQACKAFSEYHEAHWPEKVPPGTAQYWFKQAADLIGRLARESSHDKRGDK